MKKLLIHLQLLLLTQTTCLAENLYKRRLEQNDKIISTLFSFEDINTGCNVYGGRLSLMLSNKSAVEFDAVMGYDNSFKHKSISHFKTQYKWYFTRHIYSHYGLSMTSEKIEQNWKWYNKDEINYIKVTRIGIELGMGSSWIFFSKLVISLDWISRQIPFHRYYESDFSLSEKNSDVDYFKEKEEENTIIHYTSYARAFVGYIW